MTNTTLSEARMEAQAIMDKAATYRSGRWDGVNYAKALRKANALMAVAAFEASRAPKPVEAEVEIIESAEGRALKAMMAEYLASH